MGSRRLGGNFGEVKVGVVCLEGMVRFAVVMRLEYGGDEAGV